VALLETLEAIDGFDVVKLAWVHRRGDLRKA
jgi:hypothetical protein